MDIIADKYIDNYNSWFNLVVALKKCDVPIEVIKEFSMKSKKYTEEGFYKVYDAYSKEDITLGIGTLKMYAKLSNLTEYNLLHAGTSIQNNTISRY